jgi:hypothetical protein
MGLPCGLESAFTDCASYDASVVSALEKEDLLPFVYSGVSEGVSRVAVAFAHLGMNQRPHTEQASGARHDSCNISLAAHWTAAEPACLKMG